MDGVVVLVIGVNVTNDIMIAKATLATLKKDNNNNNNDLGDNNDDDAE
jgi:hypothetical protein